MSKNNVFTLIKVGFINSYGLERMYRNALRGKNKSGKSKGVGVAVLLLIAAAGIVGSISVYYWLIANVLSEINRLDMMLLLIAGAGGVAALSMSLYKAPGYLYACKDFDMLISLPIKPSSILAAKIGTLYLVTAVPSFAFTLPGLLIYGAKSGAGAGLMVWGALLLLALPVAAMLIGALAAFPIAFIGTRVRMPNFITLILYFALVVGVVVGSSVMPMLTPGQLESGVVSVGGIMKYYLPATLFLDSIGQGKIWAGAMLILLSALLLLVFSGALGRAFCKINVSMGERHTRTRYKLGQIGVSGVFRALLGKEVKNYFSTYVYVINTSMGMVLFTVYVISMAVFGYESVAAIMDLPGGGDLYKGVTALVGAFCVSISVVSAPSISIEGESLWIVKSLPLKFTDIAKSKIAMSLLVTAPLTVVNTAVFALTSEVSLIEWAGMTAALLGLCAFMAALGVLVNLYFPKLDWKNPMQAVKQSVSTILTMIIGIAASALVTAGYLLSKAALGTYLCAAAAVFLALAALSWGFLKIKGQKLFDAL